MRRELIGVILGTLCLAACAETATEQVVTVVSDPPGAACRLSRDNQDLGAVNATPASVRVAKGTAPLIVACAMGGYETITGGFEAHLVGVRLLTADSVVGAPPVVDPRNYAYPNTVKITLRR